MDQERESADVLLLDDEPRVASALAFAVQDLGFRVRAVRDSDTFWAEIGRRLPDLLLLDIDLGDSSGLSILRQLRKRPETADIPVLVLSGFIDPRLHVDAVTFGADDYISKPFTPEDLVVRMRSQLALRGSPPE